MGALLKHPQRRNAIGYRHRGYLPETGGCRGLELKGYKLRPGMRLPFADGGCGERLGAETFRYRSVPISPVRMASRTNPGIS